MGGVHVLTKQNLFVSSRKKQSEAKRQFKIERARGDAQLACFIRSTFPERNKETTCRVPLGKMIVISFHELFVTFRDPG